MQNRDLWQRLQQFQFDIDTVPFGFAKRLARDNRWSMDYATRVIDEYRKFAYLAITAGHEVTPSDEVDQAWHLHLTYTRNYWGPFKECLRTELHHGPTTGTSEDKKRFDDNYAKTLAAYKREFGTSAPVDIWPTADIRFGDAPYYQRINTKHKLILPWPEALDNAWQSVQIRTAALAGLATLLLMPAAQAVLDTQAPAKSDHSSTLIGVLLFAVVVLIGFGIAQSRKANKNAQSGTGCSGGAGGKADSDGGGDSGCGSGCGGCGGG